MVAFLNRSCYHSTIVNIALDTLTTALHASLASVQWTVTGYLLSLAAVIPVTGWASRRVGASGLYVAALGLCTLGSALCALSGNIDMPVISRVLQGIGGGALLPVGTIIWTEQATKKQMARVMSLIGVPTVLAPMLGPTIGGWLIESLGWRAIFWLNVPFGVLALALAPRLLPWMPGSDAGSFDWLGFFLIAGGSVGVTYGLAEAGIQAGFGGRAMASLLIGMVLLATFVTRSICIKRPLLNVRLYANRIFAAASITSFSLGAALFGGMILMPLYFQIVRGESVILTGLLLGPSGLGALIANRLAAPLTDRFGAGVTALAGGLVSVASTVPFVFLDAATAYWLLEIAMVVRGFGVGLSLMPALTAGYRALPPHQIAEATPRN